MYQFINANMNEISRYKNSQPIELGNEINFDTIDPAEFDSANKNEDEKHPTEPNLCMRIGNTLNVLNPSLIILESTRLARILSRSTLGVIALRPHDNAIRSDLVIPVRRSFPKISRQYR